MKLLIKWIRSIFSREKNKLRDEDLEERMKKARKNDPFIYR